MSTQERWDVVLRFLDGPLALQGDIVMRGPVVRIGANPGPGGLRLDGYRGIDDRQAVISAYDGGTVSIAPVGVNQVRVAPHEHVNWDEILVLQKPVFLSPGSVFHLGPSNRGCTAVFVEARRLGVWEQQRILSDAAQASPDVQPSNVATLDAGHGRPKWFLPALLSLPLLTAVGIGAKLLTDYVRKPKGLGPVEAGFEVYQRVELDKVQLDTSSFAGIDQAFANFVMRPNADQSRQPDLFTDSSQWDAKFLQYVRASVTAHARAANYWKRLDAVKDDYAYVLKELRAAGLPDAFAAIPYQESSYRAEARSVVCALGWWQLMPEVAHRVSVRVESCKLSGRDELWTPDRVVPVRGVLKNALYVGRNEAGAPYCRIQSGGCQVDQRTDLIESTRGSIELLKEAWDDEHIADSGAAVQITILSHNAGYDNSRFEERQVNMINILPAYQKHLKDKGLKSDPRFYGENITCHGEQYANIDATNERCGGVIANQSQHYAYSIVAQHILAACYYGENYGDSEEIWRDYRDYTYDDGYCRSFEIPTPESLRAKN
jgi:hypothetical protein